MRNNYRSRAVHWAKGGRFAALSGLAITIACVREPADPNGRVPQKGSTAAETTIGRQIAWLGDLHQPESVKYDAEKDVFYISNMVGFGSDKDANGYIVETSAGNLANSRILAENGKAGVVLDAPKGMAIHGDLATARCISPIQEFS